MANDFEWDTIVPYHANGNVVGLLCTKAFTGAEADGNLFATPVATDMCVGGKVSIRSVGGTFTATTITAQVFEGSNDTAIGDGTWQTNGAAASISSTTEIDTEHILNTLSSKVSVKITGTSVVDADCVVELFLGRGN